MNTTDKAELAALPSVRVTREGDTEPTPAPLPNRVLDDHQPPHNEPEEAGPDAD